MDKETKVQQNSEAKLKAEKALEALRRAVKKVTANQTPTQTKKA
jgi:hypothetical protein